MDFVVAGGALGALVILCGIVVRDLGPRLRPAAMDDAPDHPGATPTRLQQIPAARWRAACRSAGVTLLIAGGAIVLATVAGILANVERDTGARLVLAVSLLAFGAILVRVGLLADALIPRGRRVRAGSSPMWPADQSATDARPDEVPQESEPPVAQSVSPVASEPADSPAPKQPDRPASPLLPDLDVLLGIAPARNGRAAAPAPAAERPLAAAAGSPAPEAEAGQSEVGVAPEDRAEATAADDGEDSDQAPADAADGAADAESTPDDIPAPAGARKS